MDNSSNYSLASLTVKVLGGRTNPSECRLMLTVSVNESFTGHLRVELNTVVKCVT